MSQIFGNTAAAEANAPVDFLAALANLNAGGTPATKPAGKADRKPSQLWLNVGINLPSPDGEGTVFVSLPVGIALDDLKKIEVRGNNAQWIDLQQAKNQLLDAVQSAAAALNPGERKQIPLACEIARVSTPNSAPVAEGGLAAAVAQLFGPAK